jgi:hypothetical protein
MKPALYILALSVDALGGLLLLVALAFGHMPPTGVITAGVLVATLALNAVAIVIAWRSGSAKADQSAVVNTFG